MVEIGKIRTPVQAFFGQSDPNLLVESLQILELLILGEFRRTFTYTTWKYIKNGVWNCPYKLRSV